MLNFFKIILVLLLQKNFGMAKNIRGFLENLFENYFLNIIVNVNWFEYYTESTTLKYYHRQALNKKLELMGRTLKYFPEKLQGHELFSFMVPWAAIFFLKKTCKTLRLQ